MTILTIQEAAKFLRITKRTLYRLQEIPRVRIGRRLMFLQDDLQVWVLSRRCVANGRIEQANEMSQSSSIQHAQARNVDEPRPTPYHRNPVFRLPSFRSA